jgi:hypothetical protein
MHRRFFPGSIALFFATALVLVATPVGRQLQARTAGTRAHVCPPAC